MGSTGTGWSIEVIRDDVTRGQFKAALFDFDGTVSLIRQGWQEVMVPYFTELLLQVDREGFERADSLLCARFRR